MSDAAMSLPRARARAGRPGPLLPLSVRGLSLAYGGAAVLSDLGFDLSATGCTVILGPNGAGKSLLLKLLHGLIAPDAGRISWNGTPAAEATARQALMFQKPVLLRVKIEYTINGAPVSETGQVDQFVALTPNDDQWVFVRPLLHRREGMPQMLVIPLPHNLG